MAQLEERDALDPSCAEEMHRSLRIPEVVGMICAHLDPMPGVESGALAALARTSMIFHDTALDALWRHQDTILNLIKCMPADLWESVDTDIRRRQFRRRQILRLARPIIPSDWHRFLMYCDRVRSLTCVDAYPHPNLSAVFDVIHLHLPRDYLCPNVQKLAWGQDGPPQIDRFLGPHISSIDLRACTTNAQESLLPTLARRYPALSAVTLGNPFETAPLPHVSTFVRALSHVKLLDVSTLDVAALDHIGQLPTLETLNFALHASTSFPSISNGTMFSRLCSTNVHLRQGQINVLSAFVRTWAQPPLHTMEASIDSSPTVDDIEGFYRALIGHCPHESLEVLKLGIDDAAEPTVIRPAFVHAAYLFRHLFCFTNLAVLSIRIAGGYELDDATVYDMARAWPHIEEIYLQADVYSPRKGTLRGLAALAEHCPNLHTLELCLDASTIPELIIPPGHRLLQGSLVSLDMSYSPISDAFSVARFLSSIFVNLKEVVADYDYREEAGPALVLARDYSQRWTQVGTMLPGLGEVREEEWNRGNSWAMQTLFEIATRGVGAL
ncbi:hypothetical protein DFH09DRAFT_295115 [Mycena vulgaris]|nr:hypothetical protein DFH09DRAFT_295115 [Mycena vulgaris]